MTRRKLVLIALAAVLPACSDEAIELKASRVIRGSVETARSDQPIGLHAFDARNAIVVLVGGRILETVDGGTTWNRVRLRSPHGAARFLSRRHWLASRGRLLYETRDGGRTWRFVRRLVEPFRAHHFVGDRFAYVCRRSCAVTSDGGRTAMRVGPPPSGLCRSDVLGWSSYAFSDTRTGLAICGGTPGAGNQEKEFWRTTDGRRWRRVAAARGYGYVGRIEPLGGEAFVHHSGRLNDQITENGGKTWQGALPPESASFASWVDARVGWALERHGRDVFRTLDGGRTWRRMAPELWPLRTSFCGPRVGYGVGEPWLTGLQRDRIVYATVDGGHQWVARSRLPRALVYAVVCLRARDVFVVTSPPTRPDGFRLMRSRDAGRRWTTVRLPRDATIPQFVSPRVFFAGDGASLLTTADGGRTWRRLSFGTDPADAFAFRTSRVGFAAVSPKRADKSPPQQRLLRTADGGRTWEDVAVRIPRFRVIDLAAAGRRFWLFGMRCRIDGRGCRPQLVRTDDDGRHWQAIEHRVDAPTGARFSSAAVGVAPGVRGLLVTRDGGVTWRWERRGGF